MSVKTRDIHLSIQRQLLICSWGSQLNTQLRLPSEICFRSQERKEEFLTQSIEQREVKLYIGTGFPLKINVSKKDLGSKFSPGVGLLSADVTSVPSHSLKPTDQDG